MERVKNFTAEEDSQILQQLDSQMTKMNLSSIVDANATQFRVNKELFRAESTLQSVSDQALEIRTELLIKFNKAFSQCTRFISAEERNSVGTLSY